MTSQIFIQTCERLAAGCLFSVCQLVNVTFLTTFSRADETSSSISNRKPGNYLLDKLMRGWKCKVLENSGDFVVHCPCLQMSLCRRFVWMTKKRLSFHFSSERIKLQTFALTINKKSPTTTLESRIDSFLSNLRSSVQRLPVNRERSWLSHVDEQSIMPINLFNLFNLFDSFWTDPWSLILDPVIRWSSLLRDNFIFRKIYITYNWSAC